jgi:hypothetical protein
MSEVTGTITEAIAYARRKGQNATVLEIARKEIDRLEARLAEAEAVKDILANTLQDLDHCIDKHHFGAPKDCIPKSSIEQVLGAARGQYAAALAHRDEGGKA